MTQTVPLPPDALSTGAALCPLALNVWHASEALIGRPNEVTAIRQELSTARSGRLAAATAEGEPGIGKTRLLLAAQELAVSDGFLPIAIAADEELRGPFLLARSILASPGVREVAGGTAAAASVERALAAVMGRDDPSLAGLPAESRLLRTYDLGALAIRDLASVRPLAILLDDLQWADEDSLRLLRYVIRTDSGSPIFLMMASRPEETALVTELVTLVADMERLGLVRRLRLARLTQTETAELLRHVLRGSVNPASAAAIHAQSEGVPFIIEELGKTYREAGMLQSMDGSWTLARNAQRLLPSAVQTLIQRRAVRLPDATRSVLADAAVIGRSFSLRDLRAIASRVDGDAAESGELVEVLAPAVRGGLLTEYPEDAPADYGFTHEQVREFALTALSPSRRRRIHAAIVNLLAGDGRPAAESLPILAHHARASGNPDLAARFASEAARAALERNAPEEVLRLVDVALPAAQDARDRLGLLLLRDSALGIVRRSAERMEALAEVAALADALGDAALALDVMLRRAAALRAADDHETAADVAREARGRARAIGDRRLEMEACLELGQALLRLPIGEGYVPVLREIDAEGARDAYESAAELAEELGDQRGLAAANRELGVVAMAHARKALVDMTQSGEVPENLLQSAMAPPYMEALGRFQQALELYERAGDRHGVMASILGLAYATWGADFRFSGAIRRLEDARRLLARAKSMTSESERAFAELQILYGVHVYSREFGHPDLALERGEEAYRRARTLGERAVEFLAAGGTALLHLQMDEVGAAESWLGRAAAAAEASPTPLKARQLAMWRGRAAAGARDPESMLRHLRRAVDLAGAARAAGRCEVTARLAIEAARLGAERRDTDLLRVAEGAAHEALGLASGLPGHPPWRAEANSALAHLRLVAGDAAGALDAARAAIADLHASEMPTLLLDVRLACARAVFTAGSDEERTALRDELRLLLGGVAEHTVDDGIRARWFAGGIQAELLGHAGGVEVCRQAFRTSPLVRAHAGLPRATIDLTEEEQRVLRLMTEARTDREIAERLGLSDQQVARQLAEVLTKLNAPSRASATAFVFLHRVI